MYKLLRLLRSSTTLTFLLFVVVTIAATYPFATDPGSILTAPMASDTMSSVVRYGAIVHEHINPFTASHMTSIAQPDGIANNVGVNRVSFLSVLYLWLTSLLFGPIAAHSLETFLGYLLTAFITFLFIRSATKSAAVGVIAGLMYGFWPQMLSLGRAAPTYTHMWLFILPMWAFWLLITEGINRKRVVLAALSVVPAIFWTPYFAFHIALVGSSCLVVAAIVLSQRIGYKKTLLPIGIIAGSWIAIYGSYYLLGLTGSANDIPVRAASDAYQQSANPLMYILPGEFSTWGHGLNQMLVAHIPRALHTSLYVGISTLALAIFGLVDSLRRGKLAKSKINNELQPVVYMACLVAFICFIFSLPPSITIAGHVMDLPDSLVARHVPALRAGQRLVMPLMGALVMLAAIGIFWLANHFTGRVKYVVLAVVACVICLDLWAPTPDSSVSVVPSPAITSLKSQPSGRVAQYQASSLVGYPAQTFCAMEMYHQKPIINDCGLGRSDVNPALPSKHLAQIITLPLCEQVSGLKKLAVRYVIVATNDRAVLHCYQGQKPLLQDSQYQIFKLQ